MSSRIVRWAPSDGPAEVVAARLRVDHPGDRIDVRDEPLRDALIEAGATVARRSLLMAATTAPTTQTGAPTAPTDVQIVGMVDDPSRCAGALLRAYPPDHSDYDPDISTLVEAERALASYFAGEVIGPWIAEASAEALVDGEVAGGIVISGMPPHDTHPGGPWITEVFVDPAHQGTGIGAALLHHALGCLAAAGENTLWLAVQVDNPARRLYERVGFTVESAWTRFVL